VGLETNISSSESWRDFFFVEDFVGLASEEAGSEIKKEIVIKIPLNNIPDAEFQIGHWG
jgi:hypothetical protein